MTAIPPEAIYRVFRDLLDETPPSLRADIEALLARAEQGEKTDNQLLKLARRDRAFLQRVNTRLQILESTRGFDALPGPSSPTPGETYVCPVKGCDYRRVIAEIGEDPGECPIHHQRLV
ncbi:MAG: hypothetical protein ACPLYD_15670 [Anaerolineae bacterium]